MCQPSAPQINPNCWKNTDVFRADRKSKSCVCWSQRRCRRMLKKVSCCHILVIAEQISKFCIHIELRCPVPCTLDLLWTWHVFWFAVLNTLTSPSMSGKSNWGHVDLWAVQGPAQGLPFVWESLCVKCMRTRQVCVKAHATAVFTQPLCSPLPICHLPSSSLALCIYCNSCSPSPATGMVG